jgi:bifunctional DNA-binding transcriptional regulator/antitoxin component of YhaV-PrlF toxin-antitoxin module
MSVSAAVNTLIATVDEHGEIHVPAAEAARLGVAAGQDVVLAAAPRREIRALPKSLSIDQLAARQGKFRGQVRRAADFPQRFDSQEELDDFLGLIGVRR